VLYLIDECSDMGQQLNSKLIASLDKLLRALCCTDTGRGTGQDNCTGRQRGALGKEANQLGDAKYQVSAVKFNVSPCYFVYQK
jgi:hypothetical protein